MKFRSFASHCPQVHDEIPVGLAFLFSGKCVVARKSQPPLYFRLDAGGQDHSCKVAPLGY